MDPYQQTTGPNRFLIFVLGLVIGGAILGGAWFVRSTYFSKDLETNFSVTPTKEFSLSVSSPKTGDTVSTKKIKISGSTGTASVVVINGGVEDTIVETVNGTFSVEYNLILGENQITVVAYDEQTGGSRTETIDILYLDENLETL